MTKPVQWENGGHPIRNAAQHSPQADARCKQARLTLPARIGLVLLLGVLASACDSDKPAAATSANESQAPASQAPVAAAPAHDCSTQGDREAFIEKQIAQGHWQKVGRVAKVFHVHVVPAFLTETSPDEQQQALDVVSAFSQCEGGSSRVALHDATSGEQIGEYSDAGGLVLK